MSEAARHAAPTSEIDSADESGERSASVLVRGYRAFELLFSVHAKLARREAADDLRRVLTGVALALVAIALLVFALVLGHAAAVLLVQRRFQWDLASSIGAVAGGDVAIALLLLLVSRARLSAPVLPETRAMVKKAASVLRG